MFAVRVVGDSRPRYALKVYARAGTVPGNYVTEVGYSYPGPRDSAASRAETEFQLLKTLWLDAPSDMRVFLSEPIAPVPSVSGFLTAWASGRSARDLLRWPGPPGSEGRSRLLGGVRQCVRFLAWLNTRRSGGVLPPQACLSGHRRLLDRIPLGAGHKGHLDDLLAAVSGLHLATVLCHGEFALSNLLVRPGGPAVVVDWDTAFYGPAHFDFHMLVQNLRWWGIAPWIPQRVVSQWSEELEQEYVERVNPRAGLFSASGVFSLLQLLSLTSAWRRSAVGRALRPVVQRYVAAEIDRLDPSR